MQKINTILTLCFLLLLTNSHVSAQSRKKAKDSSVTIIFNESASAPYQKKKKTGESNIIKIAPLGFVTGLFPVLYERVVTDYLSVEIGGGLTNRNYIRGAFVGEGDEQLVKEYPWGTTSYNDDVAEPLYKFDYRKPEMGYMYRITPKIYFESDAPDGSYLGLQYNFAKYKFSIPALVNGQHTGAAQKEYENVSDYMVHFGHQIVNDRITFESSSAIGLRKVSGQKYVNDGNGKSGMAAYTQSTINFGLSFTVGYHF